MCPTKGFVPLLPSFGPPNRERKVVAQRCHGQTASTIAAQTGQWSKKERERSPVRREGLLIGAGMTGADVGDDVVDG